MYLIIIELFVFSRHPWHSFKVLVFSCCPIFNIIISVAPEVLSFPICAAAPPHHCQYVAVRDPFGSLHLKMWKINLNSLRKELLVQRVRSLSPAPWQLGLGGDPRRQTWVCGMFFPNLAASIPGRRHMWATQMEMKDWIFLLFGLFLVTNHLLL